MENKITEIVERAIPINMDCAVEKQKAHRRRIKLKGDILSLLDEQRRSLSGVAADANGASY